MLTLKRDISLDSRCGGFRPELAHCLGTCGEAALHGGAGGRGHLLLHVGQEAEREEGTEILILPSRTYPH